MSDRLAQAVSRQSIAVGVVACEHLVFAPVWGRISQGYFCSKHAQQSLLNSSLYSAKYFAFELDSEVYSSPACKSILISVWTSPQAP